MAYTKMVYIEFANFFPSTFFNDKSLPITTRSVTKWHEKYCILSLIFFLPSLLLESGEKVKGQYFSWHFVTDDQSLVTRSRKVFTMKNEKRVVFKKIKNVLRSWYFNRNIWMRSYYFFLLLLWKKNIFYSFSLIL